MQRIRIFATFAALSLAGVQSAAAQSVWPPAPAQPPARLPVQAPAQVQPQITTEDIDGIRYQTTRQVVQKVINEPRTETREYTVNRENVSVQYQDVTRSYQVPITEQQWVLGYQRSWNAFAPPVPSYRLMPVTRWETRTVTEKVPITKRDYTPEKQTQQVQVMTPRVVQDEIVQRIAIGPSPTNLANPTANVASGTNKLPEPPKPLW